MTTARPKRPSQEDYDRALALYRANAQPEQIAERVGLSMEQVEHAQLEGWPATRGKNAKDAMRAWEHEIDDRIHRSRLASLDWAQAVSEAAAVHAKDWSATLKKAGGLKQSILSVWGAAVKKAIEDAQHKGQLPPVAELAIPIEVVRSLTVLHRLMDPMHQAKIADVYRFLSGGDEEDDSVGAFEKIQASLDELTEEQLDHYDETGERPEPVQRVIEFPSAGSG